MSEPVSSSVISSPAMNRGVPIVRGASITVAEKEIVVVLGPNGAGKSSFIKAIAGLVPIESGKVELAGRDITGEPAHHMVRNGLAFVPQTENVFPLMSVDDNLKVAGGILKAKRSACSYRGNVRNFPGSWPVIAALQPAISRAGSGRCWQSRAALIVHPKLLVLDEPSAGLSPKFVSMVFEMLTDIRKSGVTILLVEQRREGRRFPIGDRAYVLVEGKDRHEGVASELWNDPVVAELYLGQRPTVSRAGGAV